MSCTPYHRARHNVTARLLNEEFAHFAVAAARRGKSPSGMLCEIAREFLARDKLQHDTIADASIMPASPVDHDRIKVG